MMIKLINILTLVRILIAVVIFTFLAIKNYYLFALFLFFIAGLTDYFDGFLARKFNATSQLGEILDPLADKILIIFLFFGLAVNLSSFLIGFAGSLILSREIWISALRDYNSRNNNVNATKVIYIAKIKTSVQLLTIFIYLIGLAFNKMLLIIFGDIFMIISVLVTLYTGYLYTINSFKN
jgi:CDP-diacylglycerol--glycerol-3-phosphate 3-phosphatidyltransferase